MKYYQESKELNIFLADTSTPLELEFVNTGISAGFPSPAEDYLQETIDLNKEVVKNPTTTFYAKVKGVSMTDAGKNCLIFAKKLSLGKESKLPFTGLTMRRFSIATLSLFL